ncbi:plasmid stabilization system [Sphingobium chlorophenolicum L-1]|uniref:Plasmid stabilization system n=1 Tax=Sphingobium chlorophenolicum L-1 TaxID=690566 RepID=F6F0R8_SPHCR|nr:type II toxin-antitoxin system RelE/ParE family toxin [Sphingobium chlorophenolicum]AEG50390.1 plasmid stabilization system [Sphingobium chlorophenolicum L-1]
MTAPEPLPIFWLSKARDQRARQFDYLLKLNRDVAIAMGNSVAATVARLSVDPDLSRVGRIAGTRELPVPDTPFILVYRIEEDAIVILRLLHKRRRFPTAEDAGVERKPKEKTVASRLVEAMVKPVSNLQARIANLPRRAQRDMESAVKILLEEFEKATTDSKAEHRRNGRILKIILFGSYARGKQVVDPVGRYFSDYDILVVVDHEDLTDAARYWDKAEDRMVDMLTASGWPQPLNLIIHSLDDVNHQLRRGRYFWVDIVREGIALFEEPGFPFEKPGELTDEEAREESQRYYRSEFGGTNRSLAKALFDRSQVQKSIDPEEQRKWRNEAAFDLHQAMERAYYCIMLVLVLYQPKSHNLNFLSKRAEQLDERLIGVWKTDTKFGKRCYELLRAAYVKARYSAHYKIDDDELDWLTERIVELQTLTRIICEERLAG